MREPILPRTEPHCRIKVATPVTRGLRKRTKPTYSICNGAVPRRSPEGMAGPARRVFALSTMQDLAAAAVRPDLALADTLTPAPADEPLDTAIGRATGHLLRCQQADGHWVFELEADATIPAEYVMLRRFFGRQDPAREARIGRYLRRIQEQEAATCEGGWPLFHGGPLDISCSVKAYFALRLVGDDRGRAAHGARPGGDPGGRRGGALQRLHPGDARAVRPGALACRAGDAARAHPAAALVPLPPVEGQLLGPHRAGAADRGDGPPAAAAGADAGSRWPGCSAPRPRR